MTTITALRTLRIAERPNLIWLEIETADGLTGLGESFRGAETVEAALHEQVAPWLLGRDARHIEAVSRHLATPYLGFHSTGAEMRAASAVDIALWDLAGQRTGLPTFVALGGGCRDRIRAYNTTGAARRAIGSEEAGIGPYDDQVAFMRDAGALARSLLAEGYSAMKIWPFDDFAPASGGHLLTATEIDRGLVPFQQVREAVGNRIEVMCELHSLFGAQSAARILKALEPFDVLWAEDPINKMDDARVLADLRRGSRVPICGSETLGAPLRFRDLLVADAIDYVMLDLAWCGGLTAGRKIAALAEAWARPVAPHDCTGPVTLMAGLHLAMHAPTAVFQEVVRATLATWYRDLVTDLPIIDAGMVLAPTMPGIGTRLQPALRERADLTVRVSGKPR